VLDRWFYFLKHAGNLEAVPASLQAEPAIVEAFDIANEAGLTPEELDDQERREIFIVTFLVKTPAFRRERLQSLRLL